ncbi:hypothetical protein N7470_005264 [Penicillium chermesinum]|nr:hypothetical protein N7470_005264 [Penicillium chermesinum]
MATFHSNASSCESLLTYLNAMKSDPSKWKLYDAIVLNRAIMNAHNCGNNLHQSLSLANFLLGWKELICITIPVPKAEGDRAEEHESWSWDLHYALFTRFTRGGWCEVRLLHPNAHGTTPLLLSRNVAHLEKLILPIAAYNAATACRQMLTEDSTTKNAAFLASVNDELKGIWAAHGITCEQGHPRPGEDGAIIAISWVNRLWMERYSEVAALCQKTHLAENPEPMPWQFSRTVPLPSFLDFFHDGLRKHLVLYHGATDHEAGEVASSRCMQCVAKRWDAVAHPPMKGWPISDLPILEDYSCLEATCSYRATELN